MEHEPVRTAVAYLRRSRVDTRRPGALSHEQQLAEIRATAAKHGDDPTVIEDWGRSGRHERQHLREGFSRLRSMIEAGEVTAVYAYDMSRLGRSLETVYALARRCGELGIPVRCASGYSPDVSTAEGRMVLGILSSIGEYFAESTRERALSLVTMRKQRGDDIGPAPYGWRTVGGRHIRNPAEDIDLLVDTYREAGGLQSTCRLLNERGVPTRKGGPWRVSTLAQILEAAEVRTRRPRPGRPATRVFALSGLLRCQCGTTLMGQGDNRRPGAVNYLCRRARVDPTHHEPGGWISERLLLPFVRDRVDGLQITEPEPGDDPVPEPVATTEDLLARRRRVIDLYKSGLIERDERDADLAAIAESLEAAETSPLEVELEGGIDWTWPIADINGLLRKLIDHVVLGPDLRPVDIVWRGRIAEWAR